MKIPEWRFLRHRSVSAGKRVLWLPVMGRLGAWAILALVLSRGVAFFGGEVLRHRTLGLRVENALRVTGGTSGISAGTPPEIAAFVEKNPFGVAPRSSVAPAPVAGETPQDATLSDVQVEGTVVGVAALVVTGEGARWILQGEDFRGYRVFRIKAGGAVLSRDGRETFLPLVFVGTAPAGESTPPSVVNEPLTPPETPPLQTASSEKIRSAAPGKEGVIARDVVNALLMNPFDELKMVRLVPKVDEQGKAGGLEVKAIEDKSLLATLGVRPGDVIKGVNGITMNNMGDVANAINSLMGGSKFDVSILRDGKPEQLSYAVK